MYFNRRRLSSMSILTLLSLTNSLCKAQLAPRPLVTAREAMVTSLDPLASEAGLRLFHQRGNALQAAVATALAVAWVVPRIASVIGTRDWTLVTSERHEDRTRN